MISDSGHKTDALGHAGEERRCRPRKTARSCQTSFDAQVSEWGNPVGRDTYDPKLSEVGLWRRTTGIETSQYREENKSSKRFPE